MLRRAVQRTSTLRAVVSPCAGLTATSHSYGSICHQSTLTKSLFPVNIMVETPSFEQKRAKVTFKKVGTVEGTVSTKFTPAAPEKMRADLSSSQKPMLNQVLRKFWKLTHPDLFTNVCYPINAYFLMFISNLHL